MNDLKVVDTAEWFNNKKKDAIDKEEEGKEKEYILKCLIDIVHWYSSENYVSDARFKVYCSLVIQFVVIVHQSIGSFNISPPPPSPGLGILYFEDGFVQILPIKKKFCSNTHTNFVKAKSATVMLYKLTKLQNLFFWAVFSWKWAIYPN